MSENRFIAALVPPSMRADLERSAAANERTLSGEIRLALRQHLEPGGSSSFTRRPELGDKGGGGSASPPSASEQT
jgi:hypothetical protein